ncbi:MAG: SusC/RagA family TonB-linked outer membrane protein [Bacteroidota bacterium]
MKLTFLLILCSLMTVSASVRSQDTKISLTMKETEISKVIRAIEKKTDYKFVYNNTIFPSNNKIDVTVSNETVANLLDKILVNTGFNYKMLEGGLIVLTQNQVSAGPVQISGLVTDENGQPLPGVTIRIKGQKTGGALTNSDGVFTIQVPDNNAVLEITYIGYLKQEIAVGTQTSFNIKLKVAFNELKEVTVSTGYQSLLKERAPGSYAQVSQATLADRPVSNLSTALQGMVAGMQAKENADGSVSFLIRGNTSLYAARAPLIVVDGFPLSTSDFSTINPNDVENVTVLKDAAAASIWGARAANGVIVVITKKGKGGNGMVVNASAFTRISTLTNLDQLIPTASSADQVAYEKLAFKNSWLFAGTSYGGSFPGDLRNPLTLAQELLYANKNGTLSTTAMNTSLDSLSKINNHNQISNLLLRRAILQQYNVNFSEGTNRSKTYASLLYENNNTRYQGTGYNKFGINFSNEYKLAKFLTFNFGAYLQYRKDETSGATLTELQQLSPYETLQNADGSYSANINVGGPNRAVAAALPLNSFPYPDWSYNLLREERGRKLTDNDYNVRIQTGFNIKLLPGLNFDTKLQYEREKTDYDNYNSDDTYYVRNMVNTYVTYNNTTRTISKVFLPLGGIDQSNSINTANYVFRNQLSFNKDISSKSSINAIIGTEISQLRTDTRVNPWLYGYYPDKLQSTVPVYGYGSSVDPFTTVTSSTAAATLSGGTTTLGYSLNRFVSYYANAAYTYDQKYTISGSVRSDASNFITSIPSLRWAPLWSVGGLWNAKRENFLSQVNFIDQLNVRATYGRNGNVEGSTSTNTLLNVSTAPSTTTGTITATIADNGNPTLRWEKTTSTDLGIDFTLFKGKFFGKIDLYNKVGTDITGLVALAAATGTTSQKFNNAGITNKGIDIELGANLKIPGVPVLYSTSFTYAYNSNTVTSLYFPALTASTMLTPPFNFVQGKPINPVYTFTYLGTVAGVPQVAGPNGAPTTMNSAALYNSGLGLQFLNYAGTATPPHTLGWYNSFKYNGFSISVLFIGKFGGVYRNNTFNYSSATVGSNKTVINQYVADVFAGRTDIPPFPNVNEGQQYLWDRYVPYLSGLVESSSYVECKEMRLDYTLPKSLMNKAKLRNVKVFAEARDLGLIWVANKKGYNPDWLPGTDRPLTTVTLGVNIGF